MDEEFLAKHDKLVLQCRADALKAVTMMELPKVVVLSDDSFSGLGLKTGRDACLTLKGMREEYGDKLPHLIGLVLHQIWFALLWGSGYMALMIAEGGVADNKYTRKLATVKGYGDNDGIMGELPPSQRDV